MSTTGAPDGTPPSQPGNLTATAPSSSQVNLSWSASTDNVGVIGYNVYRNGVQLPTATVPDATPPTTYTDDTASPGTAYTYQVSAVDAAGNESSKAAVSVTTPGGGGGSLTFAPTDDATVDASQPTVNFGTTSRLTVDNSPVNNSLLKFNVTGTAGCSISSAKLRMTIGSTTNDNSPYGGDLYGTSNAWSESSVTWNTAPAAGATKISSVATAVALNTTYFFNVAPLITGDGTISMLIKSPNSDGARYYSKESGTASQAPQLQIGCAGDTTPPSPPGNLTATASSTQVNLSWTAATDNVGVAGYKVFRNSSATALATLPGTATSYADNTVKPGTSYSYQVTALDSAGNQSTRAERDGDNNGRRRLYGERVSRFRHGDSGPVGDEHDWYGGHEWRHAERGAHGQRCAQRSDGVFQPVLDHLRSDVDDNDHHDIFNASRHVQHSGDGHRCFGDAYDDGDADRHRAYAERFLDSRVTDLRVGDRRSVRHIDDQHRAHQWFSGIGDAERVRSTQRSDRRVQPEFGDRRR